MIDCSARCETCEIFEDQCITCSEGRISPPNCHCNPSLYDTALSVLNSKCIPINCLGKCLSCENTANNCTAC